MGDHETEIELGDEGDRKKYGSILKANLRAVEKMEPLRFVVKPAK